MQLTKTLTQVPVNLDWEAPSAAVAKIFSTIGNAYRRVFGCWHLDMSRPFTREGNTYCVCLDCGARRNFDLKTWKMTGPYTLDTPKKSYICEPARAQR
jgi:hypothetical protein